MSKRANRGKEINEMFEQSTKAFDLVTTRLQEHMLLNEQLLQKRPSIYETIKRNQKIIDDPKSPAMEQLRALVVNVVEHDDLVELHQEKRDLLFSELLVTSIKMFQQEVSFELNKLHATISLQKPKTEEPEKYVNIERELADVKHVMEEEWKPLMDMLHDAIKKRDKYLDEHR